VHASLPWGVQGAGTQLGWYPARQNRTGVSSAACGRQGEASWLVGASASLSDNGNYSASAKELLHGPAQKQTQCNGSLIGNNESAVLFLVLGSFFVGFGLFQFVRWTLL
jgi:hypothetical protein